MEWTETMINAVRSSLEISVWSTLHTAHKLVYFFDGNKLFSLGSEERCPSLEFVQISLDYITQEFQFHRVGFWAAVIIRRNIEIGTNTLDLRSTWTLRLQGEGHDGVSLEVCTPHKPRILKQNICLGPVVGIKYRHFSETYR